MGDTHVKKEHSETVVDTLRQDENRSLEPSVNPQQLRRQTAAVLNVDMWGPAKRDGGLKEL